MAKFKVTIVGSDKFAKDQLSIIKNLSDRQLANIALSTKDALKNSIASSITRANSSGRLENSITAEKIDFGWGIGNISFMNKVAPYWRHVNFGSSAIGASHSHRVPSGGFDPGFQPPISGGSGGSWFVASGGFSFIPKKPIAPLNYIAKTLQVIPQIISSGLRVGI